MKEGEGGREQQKTFNGGPVYCADKILQHEPKLLENMAAGILSSFLEYVEVSHARHRHVSGMRVRGGRTRRKKRRGVRWRSGDRERAPII